MPAPASGPFQLIPEPCTLNPEHFSMYIRQLDGLYKGEIREFPPHIARELIAAGRAVNPYAEPAEVSAASPAGSASSAEPAKPSRKGRR